VEDIRRLKTKTTFKSEIKIHKISESYPTPADHSKTA
jgi:hypothetical protein